MFQYYAQEGPDVWYGTRSPWWNLQYMSQWGREMMRNACEITERGGIWVRYLYCTIPDTMVLVYVGVQRTGTKKLFDRSFFLSRNTRASVRRGTWCASNNLTGIELPIEHTERIRTMSALFDLLLDVDSIFNDGSDGDTFCTSSMHTTGSHDTVLQAGSQGMIMYMGGFRFSLSGNHPCLNLYLPGWTLDTRSKFLWAMMGIVLLGIVTEGVSKLRSRLSKRLSGTIKRWTITLLHGMQALVGYILMLATMTFSLELLGCVILGLVLGFALFYDDDDNDLHVTNNPVRRLS